MSDLVIHPSVYLFGRSAQRDSVGNNDPSYTATKQVLHEGDSHVRKFSRRNSCSVVECGVDKRLYNIEEQSLCKRAEAGFAQSIAKRYIDLNSSGGATNDASVLISTKAGPEIQRRRSFSSFSDVFTTRRKESIVEQKRKSDSCIRSSIFTFPVRSISSYASMPEDVGSQDPDDGPQDPEDGCSTATGSDSDDVFSDHSGSTEDLHTPGAMLPRTYSDLNSRMRYWLGCKYRFLVMSETLEITFLQTGVFATTDRSTKKLYLTVSLLPGKQQKQRAQLCTLDSLCKFSTKSFKFKNFTCPQIKEMTLLVKLSVDNGWFHKSVKVLQWSVKLNKCGILKSKTVWKEVDLHSMDKTN